MGTDADDSARLRDRLASDRTLLAWLRTGISVTALGFVVAKFGLFIEKLDLIANKVPNGGSSRGHVSGYLGVGLVLMGGAVMVLGFVQHRATLGGEGATTGSRGPAEWPIVVATGGCVVVAVGLAIYLVTSA